MSREQDPELISILKEGFEGALDDEERLLEFAAIGFERRMIELYEEFQRGEISLEYLAEQLGLNIWEAERLLDKRGLKSSNL
jgi:predicted HTH domain antitoxin